MLFKIKQLLQKLRNPHIINMIGNAVMTALNTVLVAVVYRYLSAEEMGNWVFFQGTIGLLDTFRAGFLSTAFVTSYAGTGKERAAEVAGSAWFLAMMVTAVFVIVNLVYRVSPYHVSDEGVELFLQWFGLTFVITLPSFIASCVLQAEQRFDRLLIVRVVSQGLSIILTIALIAVDRLNLTNLLFAGFISGGATSLMTIFLGWARVDTIRHKTGKCVKALYDFGKYSTGTALGSNLFRNSDAWIIKFMLGADKLAVYNMGVKLMELVEVPLRSFAATIMPPISAAHNQDDKHHVIYILKKYSGMLTILLIPAVVGSLFFSEVAIWLVDKKYLATPAANVFRIFMTFALLFPVERFMALTLDAINQPRINMIKLIFMVAANVIGDFAGIYIFGNIYGVALATLLPILTGLIISYNALQKYYKFSLFDVYKIGWLETQWLVRDSWIAIKKKKSNTPAQ